MKKFGKWVLIFLILLGSLATIAACGLPNPGKEKIRISSWVDGDTFTYIDAKNNTRSARLINVDSPEIHDGNANFASTNTTTRAIEYHYGMKSLMLIRDFFDPNTIVDARDFGVDKYSRHLVKIWRDQTNPGAILILRGFALVAYWWIDNNLYDMQVYFQYIVKAMEGGHGFWDFVLNAQFDSQEFSPLARDILIFLKKQNLNTPRQRLATVYKNWESFRSHYPQWILNKYMI